MPEYQENRPEADVLMNSMRSMGYSFEAAVADIIDNSISADASLIELKFPVDPVDCYVAICDDGNGMNSEELFRAMKYGSNIKGVERADNDLGRFGLGLKAASFSQCRKLTVMSKKNEVISAYSWDLDYIDNHEDAGWAVARYSEDEINGLRFKSWLDRHLHGTMVVWENFDLIEKSTGSVYQELTKYSESTCEYISLIFHRFLNNEKSGKVTIKIDEYQVVGLDPFLSDHKKTNPRRLMKLPVLDSGGTERYVTVQPYVLPFQKDMTKADIKKIGGIENYRTRQGFYIYRNQRLIIWGTWFGRQKNELTKHARVMVDIPNSLDDIWGIDIKKQHAKIPKIIQNQLTKAVDEAMDISIRTQTYRGRVAKTNEKVDYIWDRIQSRGEQFTYRINRESKIFNLIRNSVDDSTWSRIDMVLEEIENAVPYQQIYIDKSQNQVDDTVEDERLADVEAKARMLIDLAESIGSNDTGNIIDELFKSEPFINYPALKQKLKEEE